jgi:hypothetical protein
MLISAALRASGPLPLGAGSPKRMPLSDLISQTNRASLAPELAQVDDAPLAYVKPYIRRQKNDAVDAAAICEAVMRPSIPFVGVRSRLAEDSFLVWQPVDHQSGDLLFDRAQLVYVRELAAHRPPSEPPAPPDNRETPANGPGTVRA